VTAKSGAAAHAHSATPAAAEVTAAAGIGLNGEDSKGRSDKRRNADASFQFD
jgi:hypothetical protein